MPYAPGQQPCGGRSTYDALHQKSCGLVPARLDRIGSLFRVSVLAILVSACALLSGAWMFCSAGARCGPRAKAHSICPAPSCSVLWDSCFACTGSNRDGRNFFCSVPYYKVKLIDGAKRSRSWFRSSGCMSFFFRKS